MNCEFKNVPLFNLTEGLNIEDISKPEMSQFLYEPASSKNRGKQISLKEKLKTRRDFKKMFLTEPICLRLLTENPDYTSKNVLNYLKTHCREKYQDLKNARSPSNNWVDEVNELCKKVMSVLRENKEDCVENAVRLKDYMLVPDIANAAIYKLLEHAISLESKSSLSMYREIRKFYIKNYYYITKLRKQDTKNAKF